MIHIFYFEGPEFLLNILLTRKMSRDDEVAVVQHEGFWYVGHVSGQNIHYAITEVVKFSDKKKAIDFANTFGYTEYGVCVYGK